MCFFRGKNTLFSLFLQTSHGASKKGFLTSFEHTYTHFGMPTSKRFAARGWSWETCITVKYFRGSATHCHKDEDGHQRSGFIAVLHDVCWVQNCINPS